MAHAEIQELITRLPGAFQADQAGDLDAVLQFCLTGDKAGDFYATIKNGTCTTAEGKAANPTTTFNAAGQDWLDLTQGKADGMSLFMQGRLSVEGDMGIAMRMQSLFKQS